MGNTTPAVVTPGTCKHAAQMRQLSTGEGISTALFQPL